MDKRHRAFDESVDALGTLFAGRLNQARRIAIHCVSVGTDSDLLKELAAANGGEYVRR